MLKKGLIFAYFAILLFPILLLKDNLTVSTKSDVLFLIHRALGLFAFSLIFLQIILGSSRALLSKIFVPSAILKTHMSLGKFAFVLSLLHPTLLFATYFTQHNLNLVTAYFHGITFFYYLLGVFALILLIVSLTAAIFRFVIGSRWIYLHRINYLIFWLIFFHSIRLGEDTQTDLAKAMYLVYGTTVGALTLRKIYIWLTYKKLLRTLKETV